MRAAPAMLRAELLVGELACGRNRPFGLLVCRGRAPLNSSVVTDRKTNASNDDLFFSRPAVQHYGNIGKI